MPEKRTGVGASDRSRLDRPILLGIIGDSAAGKTTLATGIARILGEHQVLIICSDDYHTYSRAERAKRRITALNPDSNQIEILEQHLQLLPLPLERALRDAYQGISPALARQLVPEAWLEQPVTSLNPQQWQQQTALDKASKKRHGRRSRTTTSLNRSSSYRLRHTLQTATLGP